jgi:hypothetical protein
MTQESPARMTPEAQPRKVKRARLSCPWCAWLDTAEGDTLEAAIAAGQVRVAEHAAEVGHAVKEGRKPRVGYYQGRPIS